MKVYGMLTVEELQQQWLPDSTEFATRPNTTNVWRRCVFGRRSSWSA